MKRLLFAFAFNAALLSMWACGAALTQQDQEKLTQDTAKISTCQAAGLKCQNAAPDANPADGPSSDCYGVYDACMRDAGLR